MDEFTLIRRYFDRPTRSARGVILGVGDDAALLEAPAGHELAITTDTMVEAVHFPAGAPAHAVGFRALATNLSDLAAMGAEPAWATLALTLPEADAAWVESFARGFFELADAFEVALVGGDITRGSLSVTVGLHGVVPTGRALRRDGARPGDRVLVTGALGGGAAGLRAYPAAGERDRYLYPWPRVAEGMALRGVANAAIDISDGLAADLGHIVETSGVGADIEMERLPLMAGADRDMALTGGDDYELCLSVDPVNLDGLRAQWPAELAPLTDIGAISDSPGLRCVGTGGERYGTATRGYRHFDK